MSKIAMARVLALLTLLSAAALPGQARASAPRVRLEPDEVTVGESATLVVTTDEDQAEPELPSVTGLQISPVGREQQQSILNGQRTSSTSYLYAVRAAEEGDLTIDGILVGGKSAAPVTLHVHEQRQVAPPASVARPPSGVSSSRASNETGAERAFLRLRVDKHKLYAGESVPFMLQAFVRGGTGATLKGAPSFTSDAFVVRGLDQTPKQSETTIDGEPYLVVTWRGVLTAEKPGREPLAVTLPLSLEYRETRPHAAAPGQDRLHDLFAKGSPFGSPFQDPFFASIFDRSMSLFDRDIFADLLEQGRTVNRDLTLRAADRSAEVVALPTRGRPLDFAGAIGTFDIQAELASPQLIQGEPVDLRVAIRGSGNFGQFTAHGLADSSVWRAYTAHSEERAGSAGAGLRGALNLRQPIVPRQAGEHALPALDFSYFDPNTGHYVTKSTAAQTVRVAAAPPSRASKPTPARATQAPDLTRRAELEVRSLRAGGVPAFVWPSVVGLLMVGLVSVLGFALWRSAQRPRLLSKVSDFRAARRARAELANAAERADLDGFVRVGQRAIQRRLGVLWHMNPESVTTAELEARWPDAPEPIARVLALSERARFAGRPLAGEAGPSQAELTRWARQLDRQLRQSEVHS